ncbi:MAG: PAS domain-containing protein [Herpetosiphonaceae bacterium]|nr:PAS domain-containing protein [Herpetosiphonaceae bacterium]
MQLEDLSPKAAAERERGLLNTLMDSIPDGIYFKDTAGHFLKINQGQARNLGITQEAEALGKSDFDFFDAEHAEASRRDEQQIVASGQPLLDRLEHYVDNDGKPVWVSTTKVPAWDARGQVLGIVGISRDITELMETAVALRQAKDELEVRVAEATAELRSTNLRLQQELAERLQVEEALRAAEQERAQLLLSEQAARAEAEAALVLRDEFISIAAHELKTPVTSMLGYTQLLASRIQRGEMTNERTQRALQVIGEQTTRLWQLITLLLDASRLQVGHFMLDCRTMDVGALVRRVVAEIDPVLERHTLVTELPDTAIMIMGDELRLEQVLQNVLQNAVKYSPHGGQITLRVEHTGAAVAIAVSDQGIGIPAEAAAQLFTRFFRASNMDSRRISGLGLGLYIVKEIVDRHGGTVEVQSMEGQGSTFTLRLPISSGPVPPSSSALGF